MRDEGKTGGVLERLNGEGIPGESGVGDGGDGG